MKPLPGASLPRASPAPTVPSPPSDASAPPPWKSPRTDVHPANASTREPTAEKRKREAVIAPSRLHPCSRSMHVATTPTVWRKGSEPHVDEGIRDRLGQTYRLERQGPNRTKGRRTCRRRVDTRMWRVGKP